MRKILLFTFVFLLTAVTGAWAQLTATLSSEYTPTPTIYAGVKNYMTLTVTNNNGTAASNVAVTVSLSGENIYNGTIESIPAGETVTLHFYDNTIRPIDENTVKGNNNQNVVYTVSVNGTEQGDFSFVILYNGYLGKDYEYPNANPQLREFTFTGDVQVLTNNTYMSGSATSREESFSIDLDEGESVQKALLYVSYNWDKAPTGDFNAWTTTFNGQSISPFSSYRDQINLGGASASYGYGLVVYDVTNKVVNNDNTFVLERTTGNAAVYPSSLIVMINKPSGSPKTVYIMEEADLLSKTYNSNLEASCTYSFEHIGIGEAANLYVFAAGAQAGEGDLEINGNDFSNVWNGTSTSFDVFQTDVDPGNVSVKFVSTGSTILTLHQMLVIEKPGVIKAKEGNTGEYWATFYCGDTSYLIDEGENATAYTGEVSDEKIILHSLGKDVPKNTAVIIKGADDEISMTKVADPDLVIPTNHLHGVDIQTSTASIISSLGDGTFYVLGNTNSHFGFHKYTGTTMPAHKAFLLLSGGGSSNFFGIDDETTGLKSIENGKWKIDNYFDLSGRKVTNPTKGIFIHNGKKVVFNR